ncbi:MAG: efflux RND transporter periplasmic adaptor subunit, partial [Cyclobacteriaceae bacterium]
MNRFLKIALIAAVFIVFVGTLFFIYDKSQKKPITYSTHTPFYTTITEKVVATGSVVPEKQVDITPKISGVLEEIFVEAGDEVKKNQPLARIIIIPNMVSLNSAENRVKQAQIQFNNAIKDLERNSKLSDNEFITKVELQQTELNYERTKAELGAAKDNFLLVKKGATRSSASQSNTIIRSTIAGMVLDLPFKEGSSVIESNNFNNGSKVAVVADMSKMIFEGIVDESEVDKIREGMSMKLNIGAIDGKTFKAKITYISPKGKEESGAIQFDIKGELELREDAFIRAGYSANAHIIIEEKKDVLAIKEGLLQFDKKGKAFVEVETGEQEFKRTPIKTGLSDGINIQILSGIDSTSKIKQ